MHRNCICKLNLVSLLAEPLALMCADVLRIRSVGRRRILAINSHASPLATNTYRS